MNVSDRWCDIYKTQKGNRDLVIVSGYDWAFQENMWYMITRFLHQIFFFFFANHIPILGPCTPLNKE